MKLLFSYHLFLLYFGRDGHMLTERVDMRQTFQNVPNITYETVKRLLR